jgi:hypothetical protein
MSLLGVSCLQNPDAWYEKHFYEHEAQLNEIIAMSRTDSKVVRVAPDFTWLNNNAAWPRPESQLGFTTERWNQYRILFKEIGSRTGFARTSFDDRGEILFIAIESSGLVTAGTEKGYACSLIDPSSLARPQNDSANSNKASRWKFIHIKGCWYIYSRAS